MTAETKSIGEILGKIAENSGEFVCGIRKPASGVSRFFGRSSADARSSGERNEPHLQIELYAKSVFLRATTTGNLLMKLAAQHPRRGPCPGEGAIKAPGREAGGPGTSK